MWYLFVTKKQRSIKSNQYSLQVSPLILIDIIKIGTIVTILVYSFLSFCNSEEKILKRETLGPFDWDLIGLDWCSKDKG